MVENRREKVNIYWKECFQNSWSQTLESKYYRILPLDHWKANDFLNTLKSNIDF